MSQNNLFQGVIVLLGLALFFYVTINLLNLNTFTRSGVGGVGGVGVGSILSTLNWLVTFPPLVWAIRRSNKIFFGIFFGGIFWKLILLGGVSFYLVSQGSPQIFPILISLALTTFLLNAFGMIFLLKA